VMATAIKLQHELARHGHHRDPTPDLVVSAAARAAGAAGASIWCGPVR
jgi:hypothetical protein